MELWIRSQDKKSFRRIKTSLYLKEDLSDYAKGNVWFIVSVGDKLGEYETNERALELLDEIQGLLTPRTYIKTDLKLRQDDIDLLKKQWENVDLSKAVIVNKGLDIQPLGFIVYQMPEE